DVDGMICGVSNRFYTQLEHVRDIIGLEPGAKVLAAMNALILPTQSIFVCDTHVNENPPAEEIASMTLLAAEKVRRFGITPRAALLSHANVGSRDTESSRKMALARKLIIAADPELEIDGERHAESALSNSIRFKANPDTTLRAPDN